MKNVVTLYLGTLIVAYAAIAARIHVGVDFDIFWCAARIAVQHGPAAVFDKALITAAEQAAHHDGPMFAGAVAPWLYPPPFLLFIIPLGMLSLGAASASFIALGAAAYLGVLWLVVKPKGWRALLVFLAFPGFAIAVWYGQTSLLTLSCAAAGLLLLRRRPILSGCFFALLTIKPQFGLLFPLALIGGKHWRAFISASFATLLLWGVSTSVLGTAALTQFFTTMVEFNATWVTHNGHLWRGMPTLYAALRSFDIESSIAYAAQMVLALQLAFAVTWTWHSGARYELKCAALCSAALAAQPYVVYYDLAWLALPIAFLASDLYRHGGTRLEWTLIVAAWLCPVEAVAATCNSALGQWAVVLVPVLVGFSLYRGRCGEAKRQRGLPRMRQKRHVFAAEEPGDHAEPTASDAHTDAAGR